MSSEFIRVNTLNPSMSNNSLKENLLLINQIKYNSKEINQQDKNAIRCFGRELQNISLHLTAIIEKLTVPSETKNSIAKVINKRVVLKRIRRKNLKAKESIDISSIYSIRRMHNDTNLRTNTDLSSSSKDYKCVLDYNVKRENLQNCEEYINEIFSHLKSISKIGVAMDGYMSIIQNDINEKMRIILLDWLVDVHLKFKLLPETLFITINTIDRYLSKVRVDRKYLQLVGVTSMFIASKYEEIYAPEIKDFIYMTDHAYSKEEMIKMENDMLRVLQFNITIPSSLRYAEIIMHYIKFNDKVFFLVQYLIEISLLNYRMIKYDPLMVAVCATYIGMINEMEKIYTNEFRDGINFLFELSGLKFDECKGCLKDMVNAYNENETSKLTALKRKFSSEIFKEVGKEIVLLDFDK